MVRKILLPLDHTDPRSWEKGLPVALEQARSFGGEIHVISVIPEIIRLPNLPANYGAGAKDHVASVLRKVLDENGAADVPVTVEQGSVYREVLKRAKDGKFDMIVLASAKGSAPYYEIGPHLAQIVRYAPCSVLVVRD
ncbi:universal stress protein [Tropicimonas isoalkanivorans]|uniref:Universal stress protein F n=1 Tax=Tropicimonas isoalkanivorans TaxID=441112 RepID=A0A1I1GJ19_9RHOB|nr:universal stress protein [Tropicimonas isoalkanivorans]SFC09333.1 universal stress protein F [Tropicimonas isoalkanivorans]